MELGLSGTVTAAGWTLDLWDARLDGTVTTTRGSVAFTALVHEGALLVWTAPSGGERDARWNARDATGSAPAPAGSRPLRRRPATQGSEIAWQERRLGERRLLVAAAGSALVKRALAGTGDTVDPAHPRW